MKNDLTKSIKPFNPILSEEAEKKSSRMSSENSAFLNQLTQQELMELENENEQLYDELSIETEEIKWDESFRFDLKSLFLISNSKILNNNNNKKDKSRAK